MQASSHNNVRAALYARVSTEEQRDGQTIDSQIEELQRFASEKGWQVIAIYKDEGWSGGALERPELDRLRDDAPKGLFNVALINDVDRLARDVTHLGVIKRDLERQGVQVIFRKLPADKSPTYNLMVNILGSFAEFERELIADRTRRGKRYKVEVRKQFLGSIPPYGFRYVRKNRVTGKDGYLEVHPEEAAVVRQMYAWVDEEGLSARKVLDRLNRMRASPRKGRRTWAKSSVLRILRSETYAGVWHYNKFEACSPLGKASGAKYKRSLKSSNRLRSRNDWLPLTLPDSLQIVPRDIWERVQVQLNLNIAFSPRNEKHTYLLKGLVRCGGCHRVYVGQPCHGRFYYRCAARCSKLPTIQEGHLNHTVWAAVEEAVLNPSLIAEQVEKLNQTRESDATAAHTETAEIEKARLQIQDEETRLIEAYRLSILSPEQLRDELEKIRVRRAGLEARKNELSGKVTAFSSTTIKKSIEEYCILAARRLKGFTAVEQQRFLRFLIREIIFHGPNVTIRGVIPVSSTPEDLPSSTGTADPGRQPNRGNTATTEIEDCGRNLTQGVAFELVRSVQRIQT